MGLCCSCNTFGENTVSHIEEDRSISVNYTQPRSVDTIDGNIKREPKHKSDLGQIRLRPKLDEPSTVHRPSNPSKLASNQIVPANITIGGGAVTIGDTFTYNQVNVPSEPVVPSRNFLAQTQTYIEYEKRKLNATFTKTEAYKEVQHVLEDRHCALIVANSGDGKSTIANKLMIEHMENNNYEPVIVTCADDWKSMVTNAKDKKQFVKIDDMFGCTYTETHKLSAWLSLLDMMGTLVEARRGKLKVICTTRKLVWSEVCSNVLKFKLLAKLSIVDMTNYPLSVSEKMEMTVKYFENSKLMHKHGDIIEEIKHMNSSHGYPHCLEIFCTNSIIRNSQGIQFFKTPLKCIGEELDRLLEHDKKKICALAFILLSDKNTIDIDAIQSGEYKISDAFLGAIALARLSNETIDIISDITCLSDVYLQNVSGNITFKHITFIEMLSVFFTKHSQVLAIKLLNIDFIIENTTFNAKTKDLPETHVLLSQKVSVLTPFAIRVTKEIHKGELSIAKHDAWDIKEFIDIWVNHVTQHGPYELTKCFSVENTQQKLKMNLISFLARNSRSVYMIYLLKLEQLSTFWESQTDQLCTALAFACMHNLSKEHLCVLLTVGGYNGPVYFAKYFMHGNCIRGEQVSICTVEEHHRIGKIYEMLPAHFNTSDPQIKHYPTELPDRMNVFLFICKNAIMIFYDSDNMSPVAYSRFLDIYDSTEYKSMSHERYECSELGGRAFMFASKELKSTKTSFS